jgi:signal transduction histidine kinase
LLDVVADVTPALGFDPAVRFAGLIDTLPDAASHDLLAVLREALTNTARHAQATAVEVAIIATARRLTVEVRDDGVGIGDTGRRSGLAHLQHRAERHGGTLDLGPPETGSGDPAGTRLTWSIPLGEADLDQLA